MDKLWAPWREKYITKLIGKQKSCVFCRMAKEKKDKKNFIIIRSTYVYSVLNLYPYNNGHILVLPYRHVKYLRNLAKAERDDLFEVLELVQVLINKELKPQGYNIGINLGRAAGAGFPGHLHIHLVPRWRGDYNFMPVVSNTKVISQSLEGLHTLLTNAHKRKHRRA